ncbi:Pentatricopeptide repeat-containing protein [Platanthera zijinensis]|uniref:Pentatricopeptide repeat-containing protein n=1 Tax=Platanthera zijinensis TaxID=2320716 RepID=A0AAP0AUG8_9ASPA
MLLRSVQPNQFTFPSLLKSLSAAGDARRLINGLQVHAHVFKLGFHPDNFSQNNLIAFYFTCALPADARRVFDKMLHQDVVSWTTMLGGLCRFGLVDEARNLFDIMPERNSVSWNAMISGYCKCGRLEKAYEVFNGLPTKWLSSWNCMIGGLAIHGHGEEAIMLFKEMEEEMVKPDDITLVNVLSACAHSGLVDQGRHLFKHMIEVHGIEPKIEHFGCLVDLLGRAGLLLDANKVIDKMPMEPDASTLGALLGACKIHGNIDLGEQIGRRVIELDSKNSGRYILLGNLYASFGRWDDVANVRRLMNDRGVKKEAGWSMIEKDGTVSKFIAGGKLHPEATQIYAMVDEMIARIKLAGYVPETDARILLEIEDAGDEMNPVFFHSEKLAIAFGLLNTEEGGTIRISKNLRVCRDCHSASKLISKVYGRAIIVRDRSRFHHFREGECSCNDYW